MNTYADNGHLAAGGHLRRRTSCLRFYDQCWREFPEPHTPALHTGSCSVGSLVIFPNSGRRRRRRGGHRIYRVYTKRVSSCCFFFLVFATHELVQMWIYLGSPILVSLNYSSSSSLLSDRPSPSCRYLTPPSSSSSSITSCVYLPLSNSRSSERCVEITRQNE